MPRSDLLALTLDDLTVLSNRGLVNRAQRELDSGVVTYELAQHQETVIVRWSDDVECTLPPDAVLSDRHCTCTATTICRHLIRSILAYQRHTSAQPAVATAESEPSAITPQPWSPSQISDTDLAQYFNSTHLKRLKHSFESGQVIEVMCSNKPTARLHTLGRTLRFLVPGLGYTYCDCSEPAPCSHVPLAVWAFRRLHPGQQSGIVSNDRTGSAPVELLDEIEDALHDLLEVGLTGLPQALIGRLQRLEQRCRSEQLI